MTSTLGIGAGVKAITTQGVKHEQKTTAAGRSCHCRADRRWRSYGFAANGNTGSKGTSSAPGTLPSKGSSRSMGSSSAPGTLPPKGSSR
jgi:hypothetical protein